MALLTVLPHDAARDLLKRYGLDLVSLTPLAAGSVNSNFFLTAKREDRENSFFARIYEEQGAQGAAFELTLNERLFEAGLPVARPVRQLDGGLEAHFNGKPFAVYERLSGEVLCQRSVTPPVARAVGEALAQVHTAPLGDLQIGPSRFGFSGIEERLRRVEGSGRKDLTPAVQKIRSQSEELQQVRADDLPSGLIHGDLFRDNALVLDGKVSGLLDFESASAGPFVFDLMVTILAWCFGDELDPELTRSMVNGYVSQRPLTEPEQANLVVEGSVACLRFASTRLTDFSLRAPEGTLPLRDYRRFLDRFEALQRGDLFRILRDVF